MRRLRSLNRAYDGRISTDVGLRLSICKERARFGGVPWGSHGVSAIHPHDAGQRGVRLRRLGARAKLRGRRRPFAKINDRVALGIVSTTFHHALRQTNVIGADISDWATNSPECKVTAVQASLSNAPTEMAIRRKSAFVLRRRILEVRRSLCSNRLIDVIDRSPGSGRATAGLGV